MKQVVVKQPKKKLFIDGLIKTFRKVIGKSNLPHVIGNRKNPISLTDILMSGLAIFHLKYRSLLQFEREMRSCELLKNNLLALYGIEKVPSDTYMRERLDEIDYRELRKLFTKPFTELQRGKELEEFQYYDKHYLVALDATGVFSSNDIFCDNCREAHHKDGQITYTHQMLCAAIVHPNQKTVIPFAPEPIMNSDGKAKNDCERNASKRFIADFRREHPHLKVIMLGDAIHADGPNIKNFNAHNMRFVLSVKPGSHKALFEFTEPRKSLQDQKKSKDICKTFTHVSNDGHTYEFRYINNVELNDSHPDIKVNFLDCVVTDNRPKQKGNKPVSKKVIIDNLKIAPKNSQRFTFITDITITAVNAMQLLIGGRTRWKIENETFNTLKNQGYQFEHNFGHGKKNLNTVFCMLMMLAFFIDQIQEQCSKLFQEALEKAERKAYLWSKIRGLFDHYITPSWAELLGAIAYGFQKAVITRAASRAGP